MTMTLAAEKAYKHMGESRIGPDYVHDLIHEMSKRLDAVRRYDQYIANADAHAFVQEFWSTLQQQERENIRQLKELLANEIQKEWS
jgi:protoheme ferro-lyase